MSICLIGCFEEVEQWLRHRPHAGICYKQEKGKHGKLLPALLMHIYVRNIGMRLHCFIQHLKYSNRNVTRLHSYFLLVS